MTVEVDDDFITRCIDGYNSSRRWQERLDLINGLTRYTRDCDRAYEATLFAFLRDRSKVIRMETCGSLAWSLRKEALPVLEKELTKCTDQELKEDIEAAMDAIVHQNSNYWVDRDHSGKSFFNVL